MRMSGPGKILRIYIGEYDDWHGQPLYDAIVVRARSEGLAGVTVLRGIEGYGAHRDIHRETFLGYYDLLPIEIVIVDVKDRVEAFLPLLDGMVTNGFMTVQDCEMVKHVHEPMLDNER